MHDLTASEYGLIGTPFSSALVSRLGSIEWCCLPYLDSPSHFGRLTIKNQGGSFQIMPQGDFRSRQRSIQGTHVVETLFETPMGSGTITDWMNVNPAEPSVIPVLCRQIKMTEGKINWNLICTPRFQYGKDPALAEKYSKGILFRGNLPDDLAILQGQVPLEISANGSSAVSRFGLERGQVVHFIWSWGRPGLLLNSIQKGLPPFCQIQKTLEYWQHGAHHCSGGTGCLFGGPWHDEVIRSGLILKLLISPYSGAIAEAVTVSIQNPIKTEEASPSSNTPVTWGHRLASIREGALKLQALVNLGYLDEAQSFFSWLQEIVERDGAEGLQSFYTLDGGKNIPLRDLPYPSIQDGIGQFQLDIYGQVFLCASHYFRIFGELPESLWVRLSEIADYLCQAWKRPDFGPWGGTVVRPEHFVSSKAFCWAALDHASWLASALGKKPSPRWINEKTILHRMICEQGFDSTRNCFVRSFGGRDLDTSVLWLPLLNFLPHDDPRLLGTLDAIQSTLSTGVLLRRSSVDHPLEKNTQSDLWSTLTFISCLALVGRSQEASDRLAEFCSYIGPLGLLGDQLDSDSQRFPDYFPSGPTHFSLINAASYVSWGRGRLKPRTPLLGTLEFSLARSA